MNKADFIKTIADKAQISKTETARNLEAVLETITEIFQNNDTLILPGFGTFGVKTRAARTGRNPSTGKTINIPEAQVPFARISSKIKEQLNAKNKKTTQVKTEKQKGHLESVVE